MAMHNFPFGVFLHMYLYIASCVHVTELCIVSHVRVHNITCACPPFRVREDYMRLVANLLMRTTVC